MKIGFWCGLLLLALDFSVYFKPAECFTIPVSVSTGMAIIIALVKVKAIIVKILLGLRALGVEGFVWRRRRRRDTASFRNATLLETKINTSYQDDLMTAWNDLQETVGKVIEFDLDSCTNASSHSYSRSQTENELPWDKLLNTGVSSDLKKASINAYSSWVSKVLGSMIGDPLACQILNEELIKVSITSATPFTSTIIPNDIDENTTNNPIS